MIFLLDLFKVIFNMSVTAAYVAIGIIAVRLLLRKAPKIFSYILWSVVLFRLICPLSLSFDFSFLGLVNHNQSSSKVFDNISQELNFMQIPPQQSGKELQEGEISASLPQAVPNSGTDPMKIWRYAPVIIWLIGILALFLYSSIFYIKIRNRLKTATLLKDNIYESDRISTAFVFGFVRPKIYIPINISDTDSSFILEHERIHICRRDYLIKPLAFVILILHWFNPFMWLSYFLMGKDMEMSCDESVLRKMGDRVKGGYTGSLLSLSMKRSGLLSVNPIAFGESNVTARIKNVLKFKKPKFKVLALTVIIVSIVSIGLLTNPSKAKDATDTPDQSSNLQQITPVPSKWAPEQSIGADMAVLDFASKEIVIFHGYFGLFVYDLNTCQLIRSLDLKPLNCNMTQGDNSCVVSVSMDGGTVHLHPMSSEKMFVYSVSSETLQEIVFQPMQNAFGNQFVSIEEVVASGNGSYSYHAVQFDKDDYGLLYTTEWTLGTLSYIRGDREYGLFRNNADASLEASDINQDSGPEGDNQTLLINEPIDEKVCLGIFPTERVIEAYYIPDEESQKELVRRMEALVIKAAPEKFLKERDFLEINLAYQGFEWAILDDGTLYLYKFDEQTREYSEYFAEDNALCQMALQIAERELGIVPFDPANILKIVKAELTVAFSDNKEKVYNQVITEENTLAEMEKILSEAVAVKGGTACPFTEGIMTLTMEDGKQIKLAMATDSCCVYFVNGIYFDYQPEELRDKEDTGIDNSIIFDDFDEIPVAARGKSF